MIEFLGLHNVRSEELRSPVVTLGTFDGVHLGHRRVLEQTAAWAREAGGQSVVVTFDRHPRDVIRPASRGSFPPEADSRPVSSDTVPEDMRTRSQKAAKGGPASRGSFPSRFLTSNTASEAMRDEREKAAEGGPTLYITSLEHRLELFKQLGMDCAVVLRFREETAMTPPEEFARRALYQAIGARRVVLGFDCRFGRNRAGGIDTLRGMKGEEGGALFETREVPPVYVEGRKVSSTVIRSAVETGDLERASKYLGRPYSIMGKVIHGDSRGRDIGYPTANLNLHHELSPPEGVYHTRVVFKTGAYSGRPFESVTNIGTRPTFLKSAREGRTWVEVHILDEFHNNVYGDRMEVTFVRRLRDECRFDSRESLAEAIKEDIARIMNARGK